MNATTEKLRQLERGEGLEETLNGVAEWLFEKYKDLSADGRNTAADFTLSAYGSVVNIPRFLPPTEQE